MAARVRGTLNPHHGNTPDRNARDVETPRPATRSTRRQGSGHACVYCRQRKMRCSGDRPRCKNCEMYDEACVYARPSRKPRPTNAAIDQLRQENQQLRERTERLSRQSTGPISEDDREQVATGATPAPQSPIRSPTIRTPVSVLVADRPASPDGVATYHGPTSTLYNSSVTEQFRPAGADPEREAWMSRTLFAAAAQGRHMEVINARHGKLDFDGNEPGLVLDLLNLHWNRQHHAFLISYRPAFMRDMADPNGRYFSKLLLNAIMYGASKFSPRLELRKDPADVRTAGWKFRNRVRDLLGQALDHSSITTIQALLQMSNSLFALGDEQSAAWIYAGTAFRMMVDLGLHIDVDQLPDRAKFSEEDIEIRRRVYWSAFVVDKMQSLYQGRPASLQANDIPIRFLDEYEELEHWQPYAYTSDNSYSGHPSYSVSTFTHLCQLCIILTDVLNTIYQGDRSRSNKISNGLVQQLTKLESRIKDWATRLPAHLQVDLTNKAIDQIPPPHILSLQMMGAVLRIFLHRPFVADGHLHSASPEIAHTSLAACAEAATTIVRVVRVYDKAFGIRRAPYLICYATYVAATVHVRIAATRGGTSSEAHESLRTCLSVFDQNAETNAAAMKAAKVIRRLMRSMAVIVEGTVPMRLNAANEEVMHGQPASLPQMIESGDGVPEPPLDVDAIIQSFWNVDQRPCNPNVASDTLQHSNYMSQEGYTPAWSSMATDNWTNLGMPDTLFGFNTSDLEFLYGQTMGNV